jgi:hypothetical protein
MKKILFSVCFLFLCLGGFSQQLSHIQFSGATTLSTFSFTTDQKVIIRISPDGKVVEWGVDAGPTRYGTTYPGKLQPYMGRVEYYGADDYDSVMRGKVRFIGTTSISYYGANETADRIGKVRTVGSTQLEYYTNWDNESLRGKLKFAGTVLLDYYHSFENDAVRGKLKSVGNNTITYYSTFDDKMVIGKIRTIGPINYNWLDRGFRGGWSQINTSPVVNGITYLVL